jgi:hypothetical protein
MNPWQRRAMPAFIVVARNDASLVGRSSQRSGLQAVAECGLAQVTGSKSETGSLIGSVLISQPLDLTLKPYNGTLATFSPMLKGLRLLEEP